MRPDASSPQRQRAAGRLALGCLVAVWLAFNFPAFGGRVLFPVDLDGSIAQSGSPTGTISNSLDSDAYTLYYPLRTHLGARLRSGDIPLWDPHRFSGLPFAANPQAAVWYPPNWAFAVGDPLLVYSWILVLTRLLGLLLAYWFFRVLALHRFAAAFGSIIFMGSGFLMAWGTHMTFPASATWLPLALGGLTRVLQGRLRTGIPAAAGGLVLALLGGHPQVTLFVWMAAGLWTAVWGVALFLGQRADGARRSARTVLRPIGAAASCFVLAAGLGALHLLSMLSFSRSIVRGVEPYEGLVAGAPSVRQLLTLLIPDRFGDPIDGNQVGSINYTEAAMYAGVITLVLVAVALWHRRDRMTAAFATIGLVGSLAAFGTPFYRLLYSAVPGLSRLRGVGRFAFLLDVGLAGLAALGLDQVLRRPMAARRTLLGAGAVVLLALSLSVTVLNDGAVPGAYLLPRALFGGALLVMGVGVLIWLGGTRSKESGISAALLAMAALDLWVFGFGYHPFQPHRPIYAESTAVQFLRSADDPRGRIVRMNYYWLPPNAALVHDLYDVQGYDGLIPTRYVDLVSLIEAQRINAGGYNVVYNLSSPESLDSPVADLLGIRFVLARADQDGLGKPLNTSLFGVFERPGPLPAAFLVECWEIVPTGSALERLRQMSVDDLRSVAIIDRETVAPEALPAGGGQCEPGSPAAVERYEADTVLLRLQASRPSLVVVTDGWDEGWTATVDGEPAPIARVDHGLRGVFITPGAHQVEMTYRPDWVLPGTLVTVSAAAILALFVIYTAHRRHRP